MKTLKKNKVLFGILSLVAVLAFVLFSPAAAVGVTFAATAGLMTDTITTDSVDAAESNLHLDDISSKVTEILPARVPMNKIMRSIRESRKADSQVLRYYSVVSKELYDTTLDSASGNGTSSSVPAKEYTYSSGDGILQVFIQVTDADLWQKDQTVILLHHLCNDTVAASPTGYKDIMFWVKSVSDDVVCLVPQNGCLGSGANAAAYVVPNFTTTSKFYHAGIAKEQTAIQTTPFGIVPTDQEQFCQNYLAQVEEATFEAMTKKEVNWGFKDYEKQNIYTMSVQQELSFLKGVKAHIYDPTEKNYRYTTQGITRDITTQLEYGTGGSNRTVSQAQYNRWLRTVFTGNNGSETRVLFAGDGLMESLHGVDEYTKQLNGKNTAIEWGVTFTKIVSDFGTLLVKMHPLFPEWGLSDYGLILDMDQISKHDFVPMQMTELDLVKSGQRNAKAKVIQECSALIITNPDCHAEIWPKA